MTDSATQPGEQHHALARLEGTWRDTEAPTAEGDTVPVGIYENRFILDGFFMALDFRQMRGSTPEYGMHGLIGWDATSERYFFHWYDSLGGSATRIFGKFAGDQLTLEGSDPVCGGHTRFTWTFAGNDNTHVVTIESSEDGASWTPAMKTEYRRVLE